MLHLTAPASADMQFHFTGSCGGGGGEQEEHSGSTKKLEITLILYGDR